jgi:AraC-like DNA-binding protein
MSEPEQPDAAALNGRLEVDASVRASPLMCIPDILRKLGCEPEPVFREAGLTLAHFKNPDNEISYIAASHLLALCVAKTGCQHFGLLMAERVSSSSLGIAGFMLRFAPDVQTALQALQRNLELHDQGGIPTLTMDGKYAVFGYAIHQPGVQAIDQIYDLSVAFVYKIMRELCGPDWKPIGVLLSRRRPPDATPYKQLFRVPIRFGAAQNAIVFPARWLAQTPNGADPLLYSHLEQEADALRDNRVADIVGKLRCLLQSSLFNDTLRVQYIAEQLGMHERTLHRRLKEKGTSYRQLLADIRYRVAQQLLANPDSQVSEIAAALKYTDSSAFCRAFKSWSGCTPSQWRSKSVATRGRPEI